MSHTPKYIMYRGHVYQALLPSVKHAGKTYRDEAQHSGVTLYHVSPERLTRFSARSKFFGQAGVFFSPSYRSTIVDWAGYVIGKKFNRHPLRLEINKLFKEYFELRDKKVKTDEDTVRMEQLDARTKKLRASLNLYLDKIFSVYRVLFIYKVWCPKDVYDNSVMLYDKAFDENYREDDFGFWGWGAQIFVPEEDLDKLKIVSVKEFSKGDFRQEYQDLDRLRFQRPKSKVETKRPAGSILFSGEELRYLKRQVEKETGDKYLFALLADQDIGKYKSGTVLTAPQLGVDLLVGTIKKFQSGVQQGSRWVPFDHRKFWTKNQQRALQNKDYEVVYLSVYR